MYSIPPSQSLAHANRDAGGALPMDVDSQGTFQAASAQSGNTSAARGTELVHQLEDSFKVSVGIATSSQGRSSPRRKSPGSGSKASATKAASSAAHRSGSDSSRATDSLPFASRQSSFDEVAEGVLLRDLLFAMQAIDSKHIYFDAAVDRFQITRHVGVPTRTYSIHLCLAVNVLAAE